VVVVVVVVVCSSCSGGREDADNAERLLTGHQLGDTWCQVGQLAQPFEGLLS
jgi:hypothetical protein